MLHELLRTWFLWVEQWGYWGVFILMAMESSIIPVPSEIVMPPAAYWAAQGRMDFWGVVVAGTLGSLFGSLVMYGVSQALGRPIITRYGKYFFFSDEKIAAAETFIARHGLVGIFVARLLPVFRHLISIPAGIFKMRVLPFSLVTVTGAGIWCTILAWFGKAVIGDRPDLLQSPDELVHAMKAKLIWFVAAILVFGVLYAVVVRLQKKN